MKTIVIFYDNKSKYSEEKVFDGKSANQLCDEWASKVAEKSYSVKASSVFQLFEEFTKIIEETDAENIIYSYNDCPFLSEELTKELLNTHTEYKAEYTFADGYPYGFTPEVINAGTVKILFELAKTTYNSQAQKAVSRDGIFEFIKNDINSFDVESIVSSTDWRLFRFAFHSGAKENYLQCVNLYKQLNGKLGTPEQMSKVASETVGCLKTVPGFYNIQVTDFVSSDCIYSPYVQEYEKVHKFSPLKSQNQLKKMSLEDFTKLIEKISSFSEKAVIGLSCWGEFFSLENSTEYIEKILEHEGLSVFVETDGLFISDEICSKLKQIEEKAKPRTNGWNKINVAVRLDAFAENTYKSIYPDTDSEAFRKAVDSIGKLSAALKGCVYPQLVRMNENEGELESFYRFWSGKESPSQGNVIIQKYDNYAGALPERKVADLSPIERNVCWKLRRNMNILSNGDILPCRACLLSGAIGNVFEENIEEIWKKTDDMVNSQLKNEYNEKCRKCDEYYTYDF